MQEIVVSKPMLPGHEIMKRLSYMRVLYPIFMIVVTACAVATPALSPETMATSTPDQVIRGAQVFRDVCAECRGVDAEGYANELNAPALDSTEHAFHHPDQQIHDWIVNGKLGAGREMPSLGTRLTDGEVHSVIDYLHTLWTKEQLASQQDVTSRYPATPEPAWTPQR